MRKQSHNSPEGLSPVCTHRYTWGFVFQVSFCQLQPRGLCHAQQQHRLPPNVPAAPHTKPTSDVQPLQHFQPPRTGTKPRGWDSPEPQLCNLQRSTPAVPPCPGEEAQSRHSSGSSAGTHQLLLKSEKCTFHLRSLWIGGCHVWCPKFLPLRD